MHSYLNILGLASRARKIVTGETIIVKIRTGEVSFVIIASDASEKSIKKITDKCKFYEVEYSMVGTTEEISKAIGKINRVAVGILDIGFSKKLKEKIGG